MKEAKKSLSIMVYTVGYSTFLGTILKFKKKLVKWTDLIKKKIRRTKGLYLEQEICCLFKKIIIGS